jgi:peptidoglycan/xylan/chitin deacetylase (PgdA/CDA1 family)
MLSSVLRPRRKGDADGNVLILSYHRVVPNIEEAEREAFFGLLVSVETFRRHLEVVKECYEALSLDEAVGVLRGERKTDRAVAVITFDDGYRDVYEHALPVLRELGLPATVFIPTAYANGDKTLDHDRLYWLISKAHRLKLSLHAPLIRAGLPWKQVSDLSAGAAPFKQYNNLLRQPLSKRAEILDCLEDFLNERPAQYPAGFRLLTWEMINEMSRAGVTFGAHTERHPILTLEDEATASREIAASKEALAERLGQPVNHFAYPNGAYDGKIKEMVARAGFKAALTCDRRINNRGDDLMALGRIGLSEESTRGVTGRYSEAVARLRLIT